MISLPPLRGKARRVGWKGPWSPPSPVLPGQVGGDAIETGLDGPLDLAQSTIFHLGVKAGPAAGGGIHCCGDLARPVGWLPPPTDDARDGQTAVTTEPTPAWLERHIGNGNHWLG